MFVAILVIFFMQGPESIAGTEDASEPHFVKGKFELPLKTDAIREQWKATLGFFHCEYDGKEKGWSSMAARYSSVPTMLSDQDVGDAADVEVQDQKRCGYGKG